MESLDPRVVQYWRIQGVARLFAFWLPVSIAVGVGLSLRGGMVYGLGAAAVILGLNLLATLILPPLAYARYHYAVREHDLLVEHGVIFRHTTSIPLDRIQHVDTRQGWMERSFGLAHLIVYTAAGLSADGSIPGLDEHHAAELRDQLSRRSADDGV